jgi:hypothetical protein
MLAKPEQKSPHWLYGRGYDYEVHFAAGLACPRCVVALRPSGRRCSAHRNLRPTE